MQVAENPVVGTVVGLAIRNPRIPSGLERIDSTSLVPFTGSEYASEIVVVVFILDPEGLTTCSAMRRCS